VVIERASRPRWRFPLRQARFTDRSHSLIINADYALWDGWAEMIQGLSAIKGTAAMFRKDHLGSAAGAQMQRDSQ